MLQVHPTARLIVASLLMVAVFLPIELHQLALVYVLVLIVVLITGIGASHLRFAVVVTFPILVMLSVFWGLIEPGKGLHPHTSGLAYAVFNWLRIVACGGILQGLLLPLLEQPQHLRSFLTATGLRGSAGILLIAAIVFIPEVQRRLARIIDARKAQGYKVSGLSGLRQLPSMLMPLVASLLDSATKRAELWTHRGLLDRYKEFLIEATYRPAATAAAGVIGVVALVVGAWR